jgi:aspartate racemase
MRIIGLIGGTTWLSTADYYRYLNEMVADRLGGMHSARVILHSLDFAEVLACAGSRECEAAILIEAARSVERAGAELLALCANTAHVHAAAVAASVSIPLVHIVDALAERVRNAGAKTIAVMCTGRSRAAGVFDQLAEHRDVKLLFPTVAEQDQLDQAILSFARTGGMASDSISCARDLVSAFISRGADGIVLGCTELPQMLKDTPIESTVLFDTTLIHARAITDVALTD